MTALPWKVVAGDCCPEMRKLPWNSVDAVVCDPPYGLELMGKEFDSLGDGARQQAWHLRWAKEALLVLKPGGHLAAFGGTRTYHRLVCALEDAGFEIRDSLMWLYGSGLPKTVTVLKPSFEPIVLARKPLDGTMAANVQKWGTGALNIDETRIHSGPSVGGSKSGSTVLGVMNDDGWTPKVQDIDRSMAAGRWPANVVLDEEAGAALDAQAVGASRFFYCAKASRKERGEGNDHPTVKPLALMQWLVRLVTPKGGLVLDPFAGSGSTGLAAVREERRFLGIEQDESYVALARSRLEALRSEP